MISRQASIRLFSRLSSSRHAAAAAAVVSSPEALMWESSGAPSSVAASWTVPVSSSSSASPAVSRRWMSSTTAEGAAADADAAKKEEGASESPEAAEADSPAGPTPREQELEAEIKALKDQLLRSYAEQENTRNIAKRDVQEARQYAIKSFAKSLLEVADNLQRALDSVQTEDVKANPQLESLYQGIDMTNQGLIKAFEANGLQKYCQEPGDKFDPSLHSALMQYPDPTREPDTVGQVITVGYTLNKRVLRPAEVGVVKKT